MSKKYEPPKDSLITQTEPLIRVGLSTIPVVGGILGELLTATVAPTIRKRQGEWAEELSDAVRRLEEKDETVIDRVTGSESFTDAVILATQAAMKTGNTTKREALRNAVMNAAMPNPLNESLQAIYINMIDVLTPAHLQILKILSDPREWFNKHRNLTPPQTFTLSSFELLFNAAIPSLSGDKILIRKCVKDMQNDGLLSNFLYDSNMSAQGIWDKRTTSNGDNFLKFITDPLQ